VVGVLSSWIFPGQSASIEIVAMDLDAPSLVGGTAIRVYVRNNGPHPIDVSPVSGGWSRAWVLVIDGHPCGIDWSPSQDCGGEPCSYFGGDYTFDVGETAYITFSGGGMCLGMSYPALFDVLDPQPGRQYRVTLYSPLPEVFATTIYTPRG